MARLARITLHEDFTAWLVTSKVVGGAFLLNNLEKEHLLHLIRELSAIFYIHIHTYCIMSNHYHLVLSARNSEVHMAGEEELLARYARLRGDPDVLPPAGGICTLAVKGDSHCSCLQVYLHLLREALSLPCPPLVSLAGITRLRFADKKETESILCLIFMASISTGHGEWPPRVCVWRSHFSLLALALVTRWNPSLSYQKTFRTLPWSIKEEKHGTSGPNYPS